MTTFEFWSKIRPCLHKSSAGTHLWVARKLMRRSNRNFNTSTPRSGQTSGIWSLSLPREWGVWPLSWRVGENWTESVRVFFLAPKSLTAINTCLDKMEEVKGRVLAIGWVAVFFPVSNWTVRGILADGSSSLSYYRAKPGCMVCFHTPISSLKLYVPVRGNQPTLNNSKCTQSSTL